MRERSGQEGSNKRAGTQDDFQRKGGLEATLIEVGTANGGAAHSHVAKVSQEADNDACKSNDAIIRWAKISGDNGGCHGYAYQRGALIKAGVDDITK